MKHFAKIRAIINARGDQYWQLPLIFGIAGVVLIGVPRSLNHFLGGISWGLNIAMLGDMWQAHRKFTRRIKGFKKFDDVFAGIIAQPTRHLSETHQRAPWN